MRSVTTSSSPSWDGKRPADTSTSLSVSFVHQSDPDGSSGCKRRERNCAKSQSVSLVTLKAVLLTSSFLCDLGYSTEALSNESF